METSETKEALSEILVLLKQNNAENKKIISLLRSLWGFYKRKEENAKNNHTHRF